MQRNMVTRWLLGANLEGAISALTVPTYMEDINSITDLTDENDSTITAIEPGAGVTNYSTIN